MAASHIALLFVLIGACMATYYGDDYWGGSYYPYGRRGIGAIGGPGGWAVGGFGPRGGFVTGQRYPYYGGSWGGMGGGYYPSYPSYKGKGFY